MPARAITRVDGLTARAGMYLFHILFGYARKHVPTAKVVTSLRHQRNMQDVLLWLGAVDIDCLNLLYIYYYVSSCALYVFWVGVMCIENLHIRNNISVFIRYGSTNIMIPVATVV